VIEYVASNCFIKRFRAAVSVLVGLAVRRRQKLTSTCSLCTFDFHDEVVVGARGDDADLDDVGQRRVNEFVAP